MAVFFEPEYRAEESVLERSPRTGVPREIDIRITSQRDPHDRTLVECRNHKRKQDVQWIDAIDGKRRRLGFTRAVAVSKSGFTRGALLEAADRGISTMHLKEADEDAWRKWRFGLTSFGVVLDRHPVVRSVDLRTTQEAAPRIPDLSEVGRIALVNARTNQKILLTEWLRGFERDPELRAKLREGATNDAINHFEYRIPCDPGLGFGLEPDGVILPLVEVVLQVDFVLAEYQVPVQHLDAGGERVLVGDAVIVGQPTRVVVHESGSILKIMLESLPPERPARKSKR